MRRPDATELEFTILLFIVGGGFAASLFYAIVGLLEWL